MADRMSSKFARLLSERKLLRARTTRKMILKEIRGAETDLSDAQDSLEQRKFKWATIQAYYSLFHSARALIYSRGFREKSHYALSVALRELFANKLGEDLLDTFQQSMELREEADYGLTFSEGGAIDTIEGAQKFLQRAKKFLNIK